MSQAEVTRAESIDDQERSREGDVDRKPKSRRPANTAFRQQRLKAWQPILTPKSVLPLFFIIGVVFALIGGILIWVSSLVQEIAIDYSDCKSSAPTNTWDSVPSDKVSYTFKNSQSAPKVSWRKHNSSNGTVTCRLQFEIPDAMGPPVYMYYRLTNFYQNHRRYVQSLDLNQLKGEAVSNSSVDSGTCDKLTIDQATKKAYYPCGLIANSMFNDSIGSPQLVSGQKPTSYNMTKKGIAWSSDKELIKRTKYQPWEVVPPPNWSSYNGSYTSDSMPHLDEDEDFMVWMRTAGLPDFSKLSRRNDDAVMEPGTYELNITDQFPVTEYAGTKSILISTRTVLGGKNPFMGISYVVVSGICVVLGALFTVAYLIRPRKLGDHTYLTWDSTNQPTTAMATGRDDMRTGAA